ncbi:MAG: ferrochelatase, partial [Pseudomonadota bacterium]
GIKNIVVVTPGFVADCLETLEEIGMEAAESFHEKGGENFLAAPCLNSSPEMIDLISDLVTSELKGWAVSAQ